MVERAMLQFDWELVEEQTASAVLGQDAGMTNEGNPRQHLGKLILPVTFSADRLNMIKSFRSYCECCWHIPCHREPPLGGVAIQDRGAISGIRITRTQGRR